MLEQPVEKLVAGDHGEGCGWLSAPTMTRSRGWSLLAPSKVPVRGANGLCHGRGAWRPGFSLAGRGVGGRELQGPGALGYLVGVVLWSLRVGGETGLVRLAGEVVLYHNEHVGIESVKYG